MVILDQRWGIDVRIRDWPTHQVSKVSVPSAQRERVGGEWSRNQRPMGLVPYLLYGGDIEQHQLENGQ